MKEKTSTAWAPARMVKRALALLRTDQGLSDRRIAEGLAINQYTVARVRKQFCEEGLERALNERPRPGQKRKLSGRQEAQLVAIACSDPPEGYTHWTLKLLAEKVVQMQFAESISPETVRQILKKRAQAVVEEGVVHQQGERCSTSTILAGCATVILAGLTPLLSVGSGLHWSCSLAGQTPGSLSGGRSCLWLPQSPSGLRTPSPTR